MTISQKIKSLKTMREAQELAQTIDNQIARCALGVTLGDKACLGWRVRVTGGCAQFMYHPEWEAGNNEYEFDPTKDGQGEVVNIINDKPTNKAKYEPLGFTCAHATLYLG